jgi:hypothetical protein
MQIIYETPAAVSSVAEVLVVSEDTKRGQMQEIA